MVSSPQQNPNEWWDEKSEVSPIQDNDYEPAKPYIYLDPGHPQEISLNTAIEWAIRQSREVPGSLEFDYYQGFDDFEGSIQLLEEYWKFVSHNTTMALKSYKELEDIAKRCDSSSDQIPLAAQSMGYFSHNLALLDPNFPVPPLPGIKKILPIVARRHARFRKLPTPAQVNSHYQAVRNYILSESRDYRIPRWWDYYDTWEGLWFWWAFGWFLWLCGYRSPTAQRKRFFQHLASIHEAINKYQIALDGYFGFHLCNLRYRKFFDEPIEP